jgi:hypothetical protein
MMRNNQTTCKLSQQDSTNDAKPQRQLNFHECPQQTSSTFPVKTLPTSNKTRREFTSNSIKTFPANQISEQFSPQFSIFRGNSAKTPTISHFFAVVSPPIAYICFSSTSPEICRRFAAQHLVPFKQQFAPKLCLIKSCGKSFSCFSSFFVFVESTEKGEKENHQVENKQSANVACYEESSEEICSFVRGMN